MDFRKIILTTGIGALVLAIGLLYVKVSRSGSPEVDAAELAKAESEYRSGAARSAARPRPTPSVPTPRPSVTARAPEPETQDDPPVDPPKRPRALNMPANHLKSLTAKEPEEEDSEVTYEKRRLAANKLYDRRRFPEARDAALELLKERSDDRRMLRVVVSASCIMYEPDVAREYFQKLKEADKKAMRSRCARYEVDNLD